MQFPQFTRKFHLLWFHATAAETIGIRLPLHRATLAVTPGDFCSKLPETLERDIVSRGVSVRG